MTFTALLQGHETYVLSNAIVHPMGDDHRVHNAIAVSGGQVLAVGSAEDVAAQVPQGTPRIDLEDRAVLPGLIDSHPHALHEGLRSAVLVDLEGARNHSDIVERIARHAATVPAGTWILTTPIGEGRTYIDRTYRDLDERAFPTRDVLDRATTEHPVAIQAIAPQVPNICGFNSRALAELGLNDRLPQRIADVIVDKEPSGRITGVFRGAVTFDYNMDPYWAQVTSKIPRPELSHDEQISALTRSLAHQNSLGVTTIYEHHNMTVPQLDLYRTLHQRQGLTVRVTGGLQDEMRHALKQQLTLDEYRAYLETISKELSPGDDWLRFDTLSSGSGGGMIWMGHALRSDPYLDPFGNPTTGLRTSHPDKMRIFAEFCAERGIRANLHDGGGLDLMLDVLEEPHIAPSVRRDAWIAVHVPVVTPSVIKRFAALGMHATTCAGFTWSHGEMYIERIGEHVLQDATPLRTWIDAGVPTAHSTDWGPTTPFAQMQLAEQMVLAGSGRNISSPVHTLTRREALEAWTSTAAEVLQWPGIGSITSGAHADLTVLDRDPLTISTEELTELTVEATFVAGKPVYDRSERTGGRYTS